MTNRKTRQSMAPNRWLSPKFVIFLVAGLAVYALVQPLVNRNFGLKLPGVWQIVEQLQSPDSSKTPDAGKEIAKAQEKVSTPDSQNENSAQDNVETFLRKLSRNRYQSPAGLVYAPGSDEGHRLKHIERHLIDIPDRPGSHGVFNGNMIDFLRAIDQTYTRASKREKGTSMKEDDGATVYEANFTSPIGYLGGEAGKRQRNPKLNRMRLVIRDNNAVITAFPIR